MSTTIFSAIILMCELDTGHTLLINRKKLVTNRGTEDHETGAPPNAPLQMEWCQFFKSTVRVSRHKVISVNQLTVTRGLFIYFLQGQSQLHIISIMAIECIWPSSVVLSINPRSLNSLYIPTIWQPVIGPWMNVKIILFCFSDLLWTWLIKSATCLVKF